MFAVDHEQLKKELENDDIHDENSHNFKGGQVCTKYHRQRRTERQRHIDIQEERKRER